MLPKKAKLILNVLVLLIPTTLITNSCSSTTKEIKPTKIIETVSVPVEKTPLNITHPPVVELEKINWIIITKDNAEDIFSMLTEKQTDAVLFGLTDDNYEILSKNFAHIRAYIVQQKEIINQYKKYYE